VSTPASNNARASAVARLRLGDGLIGDLVAWHAVDELDGHITQRCLQGDAITAVCPFRQPDDEDLLKLTKTALVLLDVCPRNDKCFLTPSVALLMVSRIDFGSELIVGFQPVGTIEAGLFCNKRKTTSTTKPARPIPAIGLRKSMVKGLEADDKREQPCSAKCYKSECMPDVVLSRYVSDVVKSCEEKKREEAKG
jgi:hypothetical protein